MDKLAIIHAHVKSVKGLYLAFFRVGYNMVKRFEEKNQILGSLNFMLNRLTNIDHFLLKARYGPKLHIVHFTVFINTSSKMTRDNMHVQILFQE